MIYASGVNRLALTDVWERADPEQNVINECLVTSDKLIRTQRVEKKQVQDSNCRIRLRMRASEVASAVSMQAAPGAKAFVADKRT
jgi:hypothetical protein